MPTPLQIDHQQDQRQRAPRRRSAHARPAASSPCRRPCPPACRRQSTDPVKVTAPMKTPRKTSTRRIAISTAGLVREHAGKAGQARRVPPRPCPATRASSICGVEADEDRRKADEASASPPPAAASRSSAPAAPRSSRWHRRPRSCTSDDQPVARRPGRTAWPPRPAPCRRCRTRPRAWRFPGPKARPSERMNRTAATT